MHRAHDRRLCCKLTPLFDRVRKVLKDQHGNILSRNRNSAISNAIKTFSTTKTNDGFKHTTPASRRPESSGRQAAKDMCASIGTAEGHAATIPVYYASGHGVELATQQPPLLNVIDLPQSSKFDLVSDTTSIAFMRDLDPNQVVGTYKRPSAGKIYKRLGPMVVGKVFSIPQPPNGKRYENKQICLRKVKNKKQAYFAPIGTCLK